MARRAAASALHRFAYGTAEKTADRSIHQSSVASFAGDGASSRPSQAVGRPPATIHVRASWASRPNDPPVPLSSSSDAPPSWRAAYLGIRQLRSPGDTPVDSMGCERLMDTRATPQEQRFQILVSLMLSSQTKDEVTRAAMERLKAFGCTAKTLSETPPAAIQELIYPTGFFRRKSEAIRLAAAHCLAEHGGDIPPDLPGLLRLKGVGPKMAHIVMHAAWNAGTGIGVDIHVHRIVNRLQWVVGAAKTAAKPSEEPSPEPSAKTAAKPSPKPAGKLSRASTDTPTERSGVVGPAAMPVPVDGAGTPLWTEEEAAAVADWAAEDHTPTSTPEGTRKQLERWLPRELWGEVNLLLVGFGQTVCLPRAPLCSQCPVQSVCATGSLFLSGKLPAPGSPFRADGRRRASSPQRRRTAEMQAVDMRPVARARAIAAAAGSGTGAGLEAAAAATDAEPGLAEQPPSPEATGPGAYSSPGPHSKSASSSSSSAARCGTSTVASKRMRASQDTASHAQAAKPDARGFKPERPEGKRDRLAAAHPVSPS
jgi:endonuclease-3